MLYPSIRDVRIRTRRALLDEREYSRWIEMARRTLDSSKRDLDGGDYNWACFKAQQSAEYALKGLLYGLGIIARDRSLVNLLSKLPEELPTTGIMHVAKSLDKHYLLTRYTSAWIEGVPANYYTRQDAREAISYASLVIKWVEEQWIFLRSGDGKKRVGEIGSEDRERLG